MVEVILARPVGCLWGFAAIALGACTVKFSSFQEALVDNIIKLADCFESQPASLLNFLDTFFQTMAKEYSRLDRFRLDKYLMVKSLAKWPLI